MIKIKNLNKSYGDQIIFEKLSLDVGNEIVGLIGANGTGKTTLFKCLLGLSDYVGSISIANLDVRDNPLKIKEKVGYIPQYLPVWPDLEINEILRFFCKLRHVPFERGLTLLEKFDLVDHLKKTTALLSGGMRQKLSIVIALLSDPEILLLDEPTANLDAWATKEILTIMDSWKGKKCILFASHRLEEVKVISNRVVQFDKGRLIEPKFADISLDILNSSFQGGIDG